MDATTYYHLWNLLISRLIGKESGALSTKTTLVQSTYTRTVNHSNKTKHMKIRYFCIKDKVTSGELEIQHLPTDSMLADMLTKPLQGELFKKFRACVLNQLQPLARAEGLKECVGIST
jgi:hypothetical protein